MARPDKIDLQAARDIRRAYLLIGRLRGLTADDSAAVLHDHAVLTGVSLHAAALAVLVEWRPAGNSYRRAPAAQVHTTDDMTGRIVLRWQSREKAHVSLSGPRSNDLAVRLRRVVERAMRAGATHLIIDTRVTTGAALEFDTVIAWTGRRLWARQGTLTLRERTTDNEAPGAT